jgi:hypothetical protein
VVTKGAPVNWTVFGQMALAWVFTIPSAALAAAAIFVITQLGNHMLAGSLLALLGVVLAVPLAHVRGVEVDPEAARVPWSGLPIRDADGWAPGVVAAGTVRHEGQRAFWDVHDPERAVIVHLADEQAKGEVRRYARGKGPAAWCCGRAGCLVRS